jgi:hypothetical protein
MQAPFLSPGTRHKKREMEEIYKELNEEKMTQKMR